MESRSMAGISTNKTRKMVKALGISFGLILLVFGLGGSLVAVLGVIDPAGTKLSDDADPFGAPLTLLNAILVFLTYMGIGFAGLYLLRRALRKPGASD
jgi:hypothetical protein